IFAWEGYLKQVIFYPLFLPNDHFKKLKIMTEIITILMMALCGNELAQRIVHMINMLSIENTRHPLLSFCSSNSFKEW
ncbi:MAG: hypothetical protein WA421_11195, partial [Nitrososphaeraceae archaeon]